MNVSKKRFIEVRKRLDLDLIKRYLHEPFNFKSIKLGEFLNAQQNFWKVSTRQLFAKHSNFRPWACWSRRGSNITRNRWTSNKLIAAIKETRVQLGMLIWRACQTKPEKSRVFGSVWGPICVDGKVWNSCATMKEEFAALKSSQFEMNELSALVCVILSRFCIQKMCNNKRNDN